MVRGTNSILFLLDVAPDARKLGREVFMQMVNELWQEDPILVIGSEPATTPSGELGNQENPWAAFARLRRYGPDTLRALASIRSCPRRALHMRRDSVPLHHTRRVDRQTASALVRGPAIALFVTGAGEQPAIAQNSRLDVPLSRRQSTRPRTEPFWLMFSRYCGEHERSAKACKDWSTERARARRGRRLPRAGRGARIFWIAWQRS